MRYELHGVVLESELALDVAPVAAVGAAREVTVRRGELDPGEPDGVCVARLDRPGRGYVAVRRADGLLVRVFDVADFLVSDTEVAIVAALDVADDFLATLLAGNVLAVLLGQAGTAVLHAGAVRHDGRTLAVAGASHAGKSTFTAASCTAGALLVSDDAVALDAVGTALRVRRGPGEIRLRPSALELTSAWPGPVARRTSDGRLAVRPSRARADPQPLDAIVLLRARTEQAVEVGVDRLTAIQAFRRLLGLPRVAGWRDHAALQTHFSATSRLAEEVPCFDCTVPWGRRLTGEAAGEVLDAVAGAL